MLCFLITFLHYRKSLSPCFGDNITDVKTNEKFYFWSHFHRIVYLKLLTKEVNLFCFWTRPSIIILGPFVIEVWKYIQYRRVGSVFYGSASDCNISMNITIGIRLKINPRGFQQKCISGDFPQLLELPLLKTHIGGCFQSVPEAAVSRVFAKYRAKRTWWSPFKVKLCRNLKKVIFQNALCVSLFRLF